MSSLLIRAEDKNKWERRAPISPSDLKEIISKTDAVAYVERSKKRFFPDSAYQAAGGKLCRDMKPGDIIFGIKEIPEKKILDNKIYIFFSHTIKGQKSNMAMLKRIINSQSTLIDYEKIADEQNRRLVYFGSYAGDAGTIDILSLMGEYWDFHKIPTPFKRVNRANQYDSVDQAKTNLIKIGHKIAAKGLDSKLTPLVIGILGYGNVSKGVQQILNCLPMEEIRPQDLKVFMENRNYHSNKVYISVFKEKDLVVNRTGEKFNLKEYYNYPERFVGCFEQYMPYLSIIINAVYWEKRYPRFVTWDNVSRVYRKNDRPKLQGIADITCDVNGSIELNVKTTNSGMPAYLCDPITRKVTDGHLGKGIVLLAIDNLPCELPNDSSTFFSNQLKPLVYRILKADFNVSFEDCGLSPEIKKAVIVYKGQLTSDYKYLEAYI